jgi:hypothetical protein
VSIANLLPIRIDLLDRPTRKHRAVDEVSRLRAFLAGANALIRGLQLQLGEEEARHADTAAGRAFAEQTVEQQQADIVELTDERDYWRDEALRLRARFSGPLAAEANANAITVPCGIRDTSAVEDQATGPVTDPGHATTT